MNGVCWHLLSKRYEPIQFIALQLAKSVPRGLLTHYNQVRRFPAGFTGRGLGQSDIDALWNSCREEKVIGAESHLVPNGDCVADRFDANL